MRWLNLFLIVFAGGSLVFLVYADFYLYHNNEPDNTARNIWDDLYYVWDTGKDLLVMFLIKSALDEKDKWIIKPLFYYCSIRLLWATTVPFTGWDKNHPLMVTMMFTVLLIGVITWLVKDLIMYRQKEL